jgi:hypothetical protein
MNRDSFLKVKYSVRSFDISKCVAREEWYWVWLSVYREYSSPILPGFCDGKMRCKTMFRELITLTKWWYDYLTGTTSNHTFPWSAFEVCDSAVIWGWFLNCLPRRLAFWAERVPFISGQMESNSHFPLWSILWNRPCF